MTAAGLQRSSRRGAISGFVIVMLLSVPLVSVEIGTEKNSLRDGIYPKTNTQEDSNPIWIDGGQPWPQSGRTASRIADIPEHSPDGGAGFGEPANSSSMMSVVKPAINWEFGSYSIGTDSLATPIADMSGSIEIGPGAEERCGGSSLFTVLVQTEDVAGSEHSILRLIEGEDAELSWQVDLGVTEKVKAAPVVVDIDMDGSPEIVVAYDAGGSMYVEVWSPRMYCSVTGWTYSGHSEDLLWTWSDESLMISSEEGPYTSGILGGHKPTTQPLLADLDLDGDAELVIAALDEISEQPVLLALPLQTSGSPNSLWQVSLNKGSHPSDPAFAQVDDDTGYVLLTTIEANNGAMWVWKIDSETGSSIWQGGLSLNNLDGDTNSPHVRLPGPIIANLDSDSDPEIIVTIPSDADGSTAVDGAEFRGIEISDGSQLWEFEATNGFADAPPTAIDTDGDGTHDRVCWNTWWQTTTDRQGAAGCHDVGGTVPNQEWAQDLEQSSGNPNDEIAVAAPVWMDIDSEDEPELIVSYGRSLWAFDGSSGSPAGVNSEWSNDVELSHRTWSSPAIADVDGDATADIVLGSMVVSMAMPDVRPITDGRGIEFNPSAPDPGEEVTVTVYVENAGTSDTEDVVDVAIFANGEKIGGDGIEVLNPVDPTGSGSFSSFNVEWSGGLGEHTFELVVDPYRNLSQTRFDNDRQIRTLSIIPTYNATFEIPTEPLRVDPGDSGLTQFGIRSTGRLAGSWTLEVDSTSLPNGWTWQDETPGGISSIEIGVGQVWTPSLRIIAPSDALGSDAGFLSLTLSRDEGEEEVVANLPIEANRTRGLSIRGPDGTARSVGFGLVSEEAMAWLLIENVGNAEESQIAISWDGTEWGSDLRIFDSSGYEISALTLGPGEEMEVTARLQVPSSAVPGESVTTPLSMCVGTGDEQECSQVQLEFISSKSVTNPSHIRSVPEQGLTWEISADIPEGTGSMNWSLSDSGMAIQGWDWSGSGQVSVLGDLVSITGDSGTRAVGLLTLDLPEDARPSFHLFEDYDSEVSESPLSISIEVLQIHRAGMDVNSPTIQPYVVDVEESNLVVLKLENPGNGDDSYALSHEILLDENMTSDPGIEVSFSSNPVHLGAGSLRTVPLSVTLPESTPARVPIAVSFTMTSMGNDSVYSHEIIVFEVRQDHRWDFALIHDGEDINGTKIFLAPGEGRAVSINATNTGNLIDDISLEVDTQIFYLGSDSSEGWIANGSSIDGVEVNESVPLEINLETPGDSWNGSMMRVDVTALARDEPVMEFHFMVEVTRVPGWGVSSSISDLEIEANGSTVQIEIMQMGNNPSVPFVSTYITGQNGWLIEDLPQLPAVIPGDSATLEINVTPPENASPGRTVEMHVRVRDGDSAGLTEITMPLRVSAVQNFSMGHHGSWAVSSHGGKPPAVVSNTGNSPTTIDFRIEGSPDGWGSRGGMQIVLAVGEERGLPFELIPENGWTGPSETVRILAEDASGNEREIELEVRYSEFSWASSPYIFAQSGDDATISIHGTDESTEVLDGASRLEWSEMGWLLPVRDSTNGTISVGDERLDYFLFSEYSASRDVLCSIAGSFDDMGATCSVENGTMGFEFQILLISDEGSVLDYFYGSLDSNESAQQINLSGAEWNPLPGERRVAIRVLNDKGVLIDDFERSFDVRRSDWNVGIGEVELVGEGTGQQISVPTKRLNENLLSDADCIISLSAEGKARSHYSEHIVDMTQAFVPAPKFDRPDVEDSTELVVTISCSFPWDVDADPNDDQKTIVLSGGTAMVDRVDELGTGLLAAILVVGSYLGLSWILSNRRESERMMQLAQAAIDEKIAERRSTPPVIEENEPERLGEPESDEDEELEIVKQQTEEGDEYDQRLRRLLDR
ncbi:MAG: CARDB domain-containing protein [Candidatus Thalassarchaeaceae archaeon]